MLARKRHTIFVAVFAVCAASLVLAGCGGGGGGGDDPKPDPTPETRIHGTVSDTSGNPLDDYVVLTLVPQGGGTPIDLPVDASGAYDEEIPAGTYDLVAVRVGYQVFANPGPVDVIAETNLALDFGMTPLAANTYIQSEGCAVCHSDKYATFRNTGHPFKVNKVVNNQSPAYPYTDISHALALMGDDNGGTDNTLGTPADWSEVSYVIGGWGWKARWMDADGFIVTGSEVQYNFATGAMSSYHNDETDKSFNCGNCHTTGWRHQDDVTNDFRQDDLPGIDGTWAQTGIQCEACHGAGSKHAQTMDKGDITEHATSRSTADFLGGDMGYGLAASCGDCHTRDGEKDYPTYESAYQAAGGPEDEGGRILASGGLIKHHEQYDELLGVDPDDVKTGSSRTGPFKSAHMNCLTCHSPHLTTKHQGEIPAGATVADPDGVKNKNSDCMVCHSDNDPNLRTGGMKGLSCMDCHMPYMAKSAVGTAAVGTGPATGDIRTHLFKIDLSKDPATEQITSDGKFAYPWITKTFACDTCHNGVTQFGPVSGTGFTFHNNK